MQRPADASTPPPPPGPGLPVDPYLRLLEGLPQCVWISAPDGTLLECNRFLLDYTGLSEDEVRSGRAWQQVLHPEALPRLMESWERHVESGEPWQFEFRLRRADGAFLWHRAWYMPVKDGAGGIMAWVGIAFDVDVAHRANDERVLYAEVVASADDAIVTKRLDGIVTSWNAAAERIFGYTRAEMVGSHISKLLPPDRLGEVDAILERLRRGERIDHYETRRRRKDGRIIDVSLTTSPVRNEDGVLIGASSIKRDITERRRMEDALRESEARFRVMADSIPHLVWTTLPSGEIDYVNQRWLKEMGPDPGQPSLLERWLARMHPDEAGMVRQLWSDALRDQQPVSVECRIRPVGDDRWHWHLARAIPVRDRDGRLLRWIGTSTDIGEQKREQRALNEAAQELEREVTERTAALEERNDQMIALTYSVSHDLRAPLRAMVGYLDTLLEELGGSSNPRVASYGSRIAQAAERMDRLIQELLAYGRMSIIELHPEPTSVEPAARAALESLEGEIRARGARVELAVAGLPPVSGQPSVLTQVLFNLIGNAIKFVAPGVRPRVHIGGERRGDLVRVWVQDNGIGIAPEHRDRIFGVFEQLHGHGAYPGTGVGLAMVRSGIARMGGQVDVESEPGAGSRFWFELPMAREELAAAG